MTNEFQEQCSRRIRELVASTGKKIEFTEVIGRKEAYLRGHIEPSNTSLEVYVYDDELGLMREAKRWLLWERCDYGDQAQMLESFIQALQAHIHTAS